MRLLLVDDDPDFRRLARRLLETRGYQVVGTAGAAREALAMAGELSPDVMLIDVHLPDATGFALAARLTREYPSTTVLLTSTYNRADFEQLARDAGACGFVPKDELSGPELDRRLA